MNSKPPVLPRSLTELFTRWTPPGSAEGLPQLEAVFSAGHSNRNFLLRHGDCRFVVRLPDRTAERLGVDRHVESRVLDCVSGLGFGPEVLLCEPESGVLVTRYLESRALRVEGLAADTVIERLATVLRTLHAQPLDVPAVNIADRVRAYARELQSEDPRAWPRARRLLNSTRLVLEQYRFGRRPQALCHNDLVAANVLESAGRLCIIDWEYAGRGDPYFDLATLVEDSGFGLLDRRQLLLAYGEIGDAAEERLYRARVLYRLLSALWFLLRHRGERPESIPALARHEQALDRLLREGP